MIRIIETATKADNEERSITLDEIKNDYEHLTHSDPQEDLIFAEINANPIAYSRVEWYQEENPNNRIYTHFIYILPEWREMGIEETMMHWCESRLSTIAEKHPFDSKRYFQTFNTDRNPRFNKIIESLGYQATRYFFEMSRPLEEIPAAELPEDVEVRPAEEKDFRKIWDASIEAFRDHWGFAEPNEQDYKGYRESKYFQPELWQVAWHGDEVVGSVLNYIDHDYNQKYDKKRGWTEEITTHRDWRRKGIAGALIVRSMQMHKAKGMTEVALGVDTNNLTGAHRLYQRLGYQKIKTMTTYRKEM
jgi:ribosomal protein S18 acetylase RimI-like enzyme